jgi:hypothetical protein
MNCYLVGLLCVGMLNRFAKNGECGAFLLPSDERDISRGIGMNYLSQLAAQADILKDL